MSTETAILEAAQDRRPAEVATQNKVASLHVEGVAEQGLIIAELSQTKIVPVAVDLLRRKLIPDEVGRGTAALSGVERDVKARSGKTDDQRRSINVSQPGQPCQHSAADPRRSGRPFPGRA